MERWRTALWFLVILAPAGCSSASTGTADGANAGDPSPADPRPADPLAVTDGLPAGDPGAGVPDPALDGPWSVQVLDGTVSSPTGNDVPVHVSWPANGSAGAPYPVILLAHGFQLAATQYDSYAHRLASFGYVVLNVDYGMSIFSPSHVEGAQDLLAVLDWALVTAPVSTVADQTRVGATGHSLGGKLAILAASLDSRIRASFTLDPVDSSPALCGSSDCPDVSAGLPLAIPLGFIGETTDASGFQACAPAADNFQTFYAAAASPALEVTAIGANHMSFVDDLEGCGVVCSVCGSATVDNATVGGMARAYLVAFYERHLRGRTAYDDTLTGAVAQARYVTTGLASIAAK